MTEKVRGADSERRFSKLWAPRLLTVFAAFWTAVVFAIVFSALFPRIPRGGTVGTLLESYLTLHIVIAGALGFFLALWARRLGASRVATVTAVFALAATLGSLIPLAALVRTAHRYGATISWFDHLLVMGRGPAFPRHPNQTVEFGSVDGKALYADIYLPVRPPSGLSAPVLMMHGGGYIHGQRSRPNRWDRWLAERGYTVFDIDYRLAPPVTWNLAAQDAACAMGWIAAHAAAYGVDASRMMVAGQSAGAGLALQVAYGLGDGTVTSSCGGAVPQPAAVFAVYPPDDVALGWNLDTKAGPAQARFFLRNYIGGSPQEFPERYRAVSAIYHVRKGLPPTLIASGEHDHLVPYAGHIELVEKLNQAGVPNTLVTVPYGEHAYDVAWGSLGAQITRQALADFLREYLPATVSH
jgi:acetyl esterase/lipase